MALGGKVIIVFWGFLLFDGAHQHLLTTSNRRRRAVAMVEAAWARFSGDDMTVHFGH